MKVLLLCLGSIVALCVSGCAELQQAVVDELSPGVSSVAWPPPDWKRPFLIGFSPIPRQPVSTESWLETWDELLRRNAEVVLYHVKVDWTAFVNGPEAPSFREQEGLKWASGMAVRDQLQVFYVIDPLEPDRNEIDRQLPASIGRRFSDEKVRLAFTHCAMRIAEEYHPPYLALGSEVNTYLRRHPEDLPHLVSLLQDTAAAIKRLSPATKITATLQYELLSGTHDGTPQWDLLNALEPALDVVAITTYPSPHFNDPDAIPASYYAQLKQHTSKPVIIAESGWPTGGPAAYGGSEEKQERFLRKFVELTSDLDVELWIWWFLHDWEGAGYPDFFKTMGLRTSDGRPKRSWATWQALAARSP